MLSRVAESIFWMSRYIERAENVARFIEVNWHLILDSAQGDSEEWQPLVDTTGDTDIFFERFGEATRENVIQFLTFDTKNTNSILSCVRAARENARTVRDAISSEMWEQINLFYLMMNDEASGNKALESPYDFFSQVKLASHLFVGITDNTMAHNEGWHFCRMGSMLERADKTSRIVDVKYFRLQEPGTNDVNHDEVQWAAVLKSASAFEMYRKSYHRISPDRVVEFLLLDREFPRSILFCLMRAADSMHAITQTPAGSFRNSAEQRLGQLVSELSYAEVHPILEGGLHEYLDGLQTKLNLIGDGIWQTFFSMKTMKSFGQTQILNGPMRDRRPNQTQSQSQGKTEGQTQSQTQAPAGEAAESKAETK